MSRVVEEPLASRINDIAENAALLGAQNSSVMSVGPMADYSSNRELSMLIALKNKYCDEHSLLARNVPFATDANKTDWLAFIIFGGGTLEFVLQHIGAFLLHRLFIAKEMPTAYCSAYSSRFSTLCMRVRFREPFIMAWRWY